MWRRKNGWTDAGWGGGEGGQKGPDMQDTCAACDELTSWQCRLALAQVCALCAEVVGADPDALALVCKNGHDDRVHDRCWRSRYSNEAYKKAQHGESTKYGRGPAKERCLHDGCASFVKIKSVGKVTCHPMSSQQPRAPVVPASRHLSRRRPAPERARPGATFERARPACVGESFGARLREERRGRAPSADAGGWHMGH